MKLSEMKAVLRQRLSGNAAIVAFCQEHFSRPLNVLRRFDNHEPPKEPDCPWAHLEFLGERKNNVSRAVSRTFMLTCGIWLDPETDQGDGEDLASDLRELIEAALFAHGLGKVEPGEDVHEVNESGFWENISTLTFSNQ